MNGQNGEVRLTVLGCRGSMPAAGKEMLAFGGDTSCCQIEAQGETLFLDAGTGLVNAALPESRPLHILISHPHIDHLLGLLMFPGLSQPGRKVILYGKTVGGMSLEEQVRHLAGPPLWPATLSQYPADVQFQEACFPLSVGPFRVDAMASCHPGSSLIFRVAACGKRIVYATDFEHTEEKLHELSAFASEADLLLYDAQYTEEEYAVHKGFGHSTAEAGMRVQRESGAKRLLLIHHDPRHTDDFLRRRELALGIRYARQGEVIRL